MDDREWRDIETAPKDGTPFLAFIPMYQEFCVISYSGWGGGVWSDRGIGKWSLDEIQHWMPLPDPPEDQ